MTTCYYVHKTRASDGTVLGRWGFTFTDLDLAIAQAEAFNALERRYREMSASIGREVPAERRFVWVPLKVAAL